MAYYSLPSVSVNFHPWLVESVDLKSVDAEHHVVRRGGRIQEAAVSGDVRKPL